MLPRNARFAALALTLALAACQKGESQNAGGSGGSGGTGGSGGAGGTTAPLCGSCAYAFANGGVPCDTAASDAYDALTSCACNACSAACSDSLCSQKPSNPTCGACLEKACGYVTQECAAN
jgi:hypothetical protein